MNVELQNTGFRHNKLIVCNAVIKC